MCAGGMNRTLFLLLILQTWQLGFFVCVFFLPQPCKHTVTFGPTFLVFCTSGEVYLGIALQQRPQVPAHLRPACLALCLNSLPEGTAVCTLPYM